MLLIWIFIRCRYFLCIIHKLTFKVGLHMCVCIYIYMYDLIIDRLLLYHPNLVRYYMNGNKFKRCCIMWIGWTHMYYKRFSRVHSEWHDEILHHHRVDHSMLRLSIGNFSTPIHLQELQDGEILDSLGSVKYLQAEVDCK
jgi:hypothetical protein